MKIKVIKVGGKVIDDHFKLNEFLNAFAAVDGLKVLVHGGGKIAGEVATRLGLTVQQINGRRITDADTLETVVMVYAGLINKQIVASLQARGLNALGCCGADLNFIRSVKRVSAEIDFGYVGDVDVNSVAVTELLNLLNNDIVPVFSAITHDGKGQLLNTNADAVASVLASALNTLMPCTLSLCFEGSAVMNGEELIHELNEDQLEKLIKEGIVNQGMLAKLQEGFKAKKAGVEVNVCSYKSIGDSRYLGGTKLI